MQFVQRPGGVWHLIDETAPSDANLIAAVNGRVSWDSQLFQGLLTESDELRKVGAKRPLFAEMNLLPADEVKPAWLKWIGAKLAAATDPDEKKRLNLYLDLATRHSPFATFREAMAADHGHAFRRLESRRDVPLWTDAAAQYRSD